MSVRNPKLRRPAAWITALMVLASLVVPMAAPASAGHDPAHDLNCVPENSQGAAGPGVTFLVTCTVFMPAATGPAVEHQVDGEIEGVNTSDPGTPDPDGGGPAPAGGNANSGGDTAFTPKNPDFTDTCTDGDDATDNDMCTVYFAWTGPNPGEDELTAWIDDDADNSTFTEPATGGFADADGTEGPNAGTTDDSQPAAGAEPGSKTEVDDTDVILRSWTGALPNEAILDCDDDGNPGDENDGTTGDDETKQPGQSQEYTCILFNDNNGGDFTQPANSNGIFDGNDAPISGVRIDAENLNGANDPDTSGQGQSPATPPNVNTADYNDACTTGADGRCTYTLEASENETGTALICFWADSDTDNVYDEDGVDEDGGECNSEGGGAGTDHTTEGDQDTSSETTDIARIIWAAVGTGLRLDAEPEYGSANTMSAAGSTHTVTATAFDGFGAVAPNQPVDFRIEAGRNVAKGQICDNVNTNANGVATCTYTDVGLAADPIAPGTADPDVDIIDACISTGAAGFNCIAPGPDGITDAPERDNAADQVEQNWWNQQPAPASFLLDMWLFPGVVNCGTAFQETAPSSPVNTGWPICAQVLDGSNQPLPGQQVVFTNNGPVGDFYNDVDGDGNYEPAGGDTIIPGDTVTRSTDENGHARAFLTSSQAGNSNITATLGSLSDTGTKPWASAAVRTLTCDPEDAENDVNQPHTINCTALDLNGEPASGAAIDVVEDGSATITNSAQVVSQPFYGNTRQVHAYTTDANGNIQITMNSQVEGDNTVEAAVAVDAADGAAGRNSAPNDADDDCDSRANEAGPGAGVGSQPGAAAGQCFHQVSKGYVEPDPQCDDDIDNDGDGFIDHPDDPGCTSLTDNSEEPFNTADPTVVRHDRSLGMRVRHARNGNKLLIRGRLRAPTNNECRRQEEVVIQQRIGKSWVTLLTAITNGRGRYSGLVDHFKGRVRAVARRSRHFDAATNTRHVCKRAGARRSHRHRG